MKGGIYTVVGKECGRDWYKLLKWASPAFGSDSLRDLQPPFGWLTMETSETSCQSGWYWDLRCFPCRHVSRLVIHGSLQRYGIWKAATRSSTGEQDANFISAARSRDNCDPLWTNKQRKLHTHTYTQFAGLWQPTKRPRETAPLVIYMVD